MINQLPIIMILSDLISDISLKYFILYKQIKKVCIYNVEDIV